MLFEDRLNKKSKTKIYKKIIKKAAQGLTYALIKKEGIKSQASTEGKTWLQQPYTSLVNLLVNVLVELLVNVLVELLVELLVNELGYVYLLQKPMQLSN